MLIFETVVLGMLKYERADKTVMNQDSVFGNIEVHNYELFLGNLDIGVMEMAMDEDHVFIFNVYLEFDYRGKGLFTEWLQSLGLLIICFQPVADALPYWKRTADEIYL